MCGLEVATIVIHEISQIHLLFAPILAHYLILDNSIPRERQSGTEKDLLWLMCEWHSCLLWICSAKSPQEMNEFDK